MAFVSNLDQEALPSTTSVPLVPSKEGTESDLRHMC